MRLYSLSRSWDVLPAIVCWSLISFIYVFGAMFALGSMRA